MRTRLVQPTPLQTIPAGAVVADWAEVAAWAAPAAFGRQPGRRRSRGAAWRAWRAAHHAQPRVATARSWVCTGARTCSLRDPHAGVAGVACTQPAEHSRRQRSVALRHKRVCECRMGVHLRHRAAQHTHQRMANAEHAHAPAPARRPAAAWNRLRDVTCAARSSAAPSSARCTT